MGRGLYPPLPDRRRAGGAAPARRRGGRRGVHQGVEARRHRRGVWAGAAERVRRGAAGRPRVHPQPEDASRRPRPTPRPIWRARSSSIPTSGSSRSRTAPGAIFSIRCVSAEAAQALSRLARLHELVPRHLGPRHRQRRRAALARLVVPDIAADARRLGVRGDFFAAGWLACQIAIRRSAASRFDLFVQQREFVDPLHRLADRRVEAQQDALQHRRPACRAPRPPPRSARRTRPRSARRACAREMPSMRSSSRANSLAVVAERRGFQPMDRLRAAWPA